MVKFDEGKKNLGDSKQSDGCSPTRQRSLLGINLLKAQVVAVLVKIFQTRSIPLLVLFRIFVFQTTDILSQLLQHLLFKLTLWLA